MKTTLLLSALVGLCAVVPLPVQAQSVLVDFSSANSITDNLNKGTIVTSDGSALASMGNVTYSATTGLSGGGGGQNPPANGDIFMYGTKQAFSSTFTSATTSVYVQVKAGVNSGGGLALTMGFSSLSTPESGNGGTSGSATSIPRPTTFASQTQNSLAIVLRENTGTPDTWSFVAYNNASPITGSSSISLTAGNWYFWQTTYANNGAGSVTFTANLYSSDTDGIVSGGALLTYTQTVSNTALLSSDLYGFISSQNGDRRGIAQLDNLSFSATSAIPEPSAYAAIFGLFGLAVAVITRRHRRN